MTAPQEAWPSIDEILFPVGVPSAEGISGRYGLTQAVVEALLKQRYVQENPSVQDPLTQFFTVTNLRKGPIPRAIIEVIVNRLFGGLTAFNTTQDAIMAIKRVPGLADLVEAVTGVEDGDLADIGTQFLNIRNFFQSIDFMDPDFDPEAAGEQFTNLVVKPFLEFITGRISLGLLPQIPWSHLGEVEPDLLFDGDFDTDVSVATNPEWHWDGAEGFESPGSVFVDADGDVHELLSGEDAIAVTEGQRIAVSARTKWSGLVASGSPIVLGVSEFDSAGGLVSAPVVDFVSAPGASGSWTSKVLQGTYTVPAGVAGVRVRIAVTGSATAGRVHFDKVRARKTGLPVLVTALQSALDDVGEWLEGLVDDLLSRFGIGSSGTLLDRILDLGDEIEDLLDTAQEAAATADDAFGDLGDLIADLLSNPNSRLGGGISTGKISGLEATLTGLGGQISTTATTVWNAVFQGIFGAAPPSDQTEADAVAALETINGRFTVLEGLGVRTEYSVSGTWVNPHPTEHRRMSAICIGGGDGGGQGVVGEQFPGGLGGGWFKKDFWTDELPATVTFVIGTAGTGAATASNYGNAGNPTIFGSTGTEWLRSVRGRGGWEREDGMIIATSANPGKGGACGFVTIASGTDYRSRGDIAAEDGEDSAFAGGGRRGIDTGDGLAGDSAPAGTTSGGGGGGGGHTVGVGGAGGYPGGGGGAGTKSNSIGSPNQPGGAGAPGKLITTIYDA